MAHINPHLPFVPAFLVNFILRVASPFAYRMMSKVSLPLSLPHHFNPCNLDEHSLSLKADC